MIEKDVKSIRKSLSIIVVVLILYILNILSLVFIPLAFGMFLALLFSPLMRWLTNRKVPSVIGILAVFAILSLVFTISYKVVEMTSKELTSIDDTFIETTETRLNEILDPVLKVMQIEPHLGESNLSALLNNEKVISNLFKNVGSGINMARNFLTTLLMSIFFMVLFLIGAVNIEKVMDVLLFKEKEKAANTYHQIEKDIFLFIGVKILMSLLTGIGVGIACYSFGVSFPLFWGVTTFLLNFIQLVGSVIVVIILTIFALVELNISGSLLFFTLILIGIQALIGAVLEPIMMGRSFSINTITILVMLSVWALIWGVPGLIIAVPMTALIKKLMERFPSTATYAEIMS